MGKTIKRKWLKALKGESPHGAYLRATGTLYEENEKGRDCFCALGVLLNETCGFTGNGDIPPTSEQATRVRYIVPGGGRYDDHER